jgi:hypothetical protein
MKAITLHQPCASLVAMGEKKIETRSWSTKYRGPLAIHAGKKFTQDQLNLCCKEPFREAISKMDLKPWSYGLFGYVIAVCRLVDCIQIPSTASILKYWASVFSLFPPMTSQFKHVSIPPSSPELDFGDYTPGRYAWILDEVEILPEPISAKGMLGLWNWEITEKGEG